MIQNMDETRALFLRQLSQAITLDHPYESSRLEFERKIAASVLILWGFSKNSGGEPSVLLTRRTETVEAHKGQMAFPGGTRDPEDSSEVHTALRESDEEVGIHPQSVEVIGVLPPLSRVTGFWVSPVIGVLRESIEMVQLDLNSNEIDEAFWVPRSELLRSYRREFIPYRSVRYPIDVFLQEPNRVWGMTGSLLKNLLDRLDRLERLG